jgi:hypothetical protein
MSRSWLGIDSDSVSVHDQELDQSRNSRFQRLLDYPMNPTPPTAAQTASLSDHKFGQLKDYEHTNYRRMLMCIHRPIARHRRWGVFFLVMTVVFLLVCLFDFFFPVSLLLSLAAFSLATFAFLSRRPRTPLPDLPQPPVQPTSAPARPSPLLNDAHLRAVLRPTTQTYRAFVNADRASAESREVRASPSRDAGELDQLARQALDTLKIRSRIDRSVRNVKRFLSRRVLAKLVREFQSGDPVVRQMLDIPGHEKSSVYVKERVRLFSASEFLAGQLGGRGARFQDAEWTPGLPSDNEIILHILSVWLSFRMTGKKKGQPVIDKFAEKHLAIVKERQVESETDIFLCTDDWNKFFIKVAPGYDGTAIYWAGAGRDALYQALVLFFKLVEIRLDWQLEGIDLTAPRIALDQLFQDNI